MITKPSGALATMPNVNKMPLPVDPSKMARPKSMGQGDNYFPDIHNQGVAQQMLMRGNVNAMPPSLLNQGRYGGFQDNYFPEARMNMPQNMNQGMNPIQGAQGNMGYAQGNMDNYFPEARMNSPYQQDPRVQQIQNMAQRPANPQLGNIKQVQMPQGGVMGLARNQMNSMMNNGGMQRLSPGVYRDAQGRTVRR